MEGGKDRCGESAPGGKPGVGEQTMHGLLDGIKLGDLARDFFGNWRAVLFESLHEAPARMGPVKDERPRDPGPSSLDDRSAMLTSF